MGDPMSNPTKPRRIWRIVLVLSLALNLAIVGMVIGAASSGRIGDAPRSFDLGLGPMARALNPQERREIGRGLRDNRALRGFDLRGQAMDMVAALQAEPFDPVRLSGVLDLQNEKMAELQQQTQERLIEQITQMDPARRAEFAAQLREEMARGPQLRQR